MSLGKLLKQRFLLKLPNKNCSPAYGYKESKRLSCSETVQRNLLWGNPPLLLHVHCAGEYSSKPFFTGGLRIPPSTKRRSILRQDRPPAFGVPGSFARLPKEAVALGTTPTKTTPSHQKEWRRGASDCPPCSAKMNLWGTPAPALPFLGLAREANGTASPLSSPKVTRPNAAQGGQHWQHWHFARQRRVSELRSVAERRLAWLDRESLVEKHQK